MDFAPRRTYQESEAVNVGIGGGDSDSDAEDGDGDTADSGRNADVEASASKCRRAAKERGKQNQTRNQLRRERTYKEMSTGNWWWHTQVCL
jgi:hypothetical protein